MTQSLRWMKKEKKRENSRIKKLTKIQLSFINLFLSSIEYSLIYVDPPSSSNLYKVLHFLSCSIMIQQQQMMRRIHACVYLWTIIDELYAHFKKRRESEMLSMHVCMYHVRFTSSSMVKESIWMDGWLAAKWSIDRW